MELDKWDIDKLLDTDNLKAVPVDLKRLSDVVDNDFATKLYVMNWLKKLMSLKLRIIG